MSLYVSGHYPTINGRDIPRNPVIKIYFNQELFTSSVDYRVISVHDALYNTIPGDVSWDYTQAGTPSGIASVLTYTPSILLDINKKYSVYVHKEPDSVISKYDEGLLDTYRFSFITGSGTVLNEDPTVLEQLYIDLQHAIDIGDYEEAARIQDLIDQYEGGSLSGELPVEEVVEELSVVSTYPTNEQANVTGLKFIEINFNDTLEASGVALGEYISVVSKNVLE